MMLNDNDIAEFQRIYKAEFGKEISREEALEQGIKLLTLMKAIYKPMTKEQQDAIQADGVRRLEERYVGKNAIQEFLSEE